MARSTSFIGLTYKARQMVVGNKILQYTVKGHKHYPNGQVTHFEDKVFGFDVIVEEYLKYEGMCQEQYPLHRYTFPDKLALLEYVQADPWSSGPVVFLALKNEAGDVLEESLWSDEEMEQYI